MGVPKETNEVRMLGVLPSQGADPIPVGKIPDGGTQILKHSSAENTTSIIHTVDSGKILYLSAVTFSIYFTETVSGAGQLFIRDENDANVIMLFVVTRTALNGATVGQLFCPPIEIPALWDICVLSEIGSLYAYGFIHGYEA